MTFFPRNIILRHYTEFELTLDLKRKYENPPGETFKPRGLWLSVGDAWERWCRDEEFGSDRLDYYTKFRIVDSERWLTLDTREKILAFTSEYRVERYKDIGLVEWGRVQRDYAAVLFSPYLKGMRLGLDFPSWYYALDCDSACVWDLTTIIETGEPNAKNF